MFGLLFSPLSYAVLLDNNTMSCLQIATCKVKNFVLSVEVCPWPVNSFYRSIIEVGLQCFSGSFGIFFQRLHEVSVSADGLSQPPWTRIIVPGVNVAKLFFSLSGQIS